MAEVRLVIDGAVMDRLLKGQDGPVVRHLTSILDRTIAAARPRIHRRFTGPIAPRGASGSAKGTQGVTLENALVKRFLTTERGPTGTVAAERYYAYWVHEGNDPGGGRIYPTHASVLVFVVPGGGFVFAKSVKASKPNPFLRDALAEVMAAGG